MPGAEKTVTRPERAFGRPAHDLHGRARAGVDGADAEAVGVGVLRGFDDAGDGEAAELLGRVLDTLDLEADAGEGVGDVGQGSLGVEVVLEPGKREFHDDNPGRGLAMS